MNTEHAQALSKIKSQITEWKKKQYQITNFIKLKKLRLSKFEQDKIKYQHN